MKRTGGVALLVLLLQHCLEHTQAVDSKPPKPSDHLKELSDIVYQQQTELAQMKAELKYLEKESSELKTKMTKQIKHRRQTESQLETLNKEMSAQLAEVSVIRTTLTNSETEVAKLKKENDALKTKLSATEGHLKISRKDITDKTKVAFSAGLSASVGPLSGLGVVVYNKVLTNTGGAYNPKTGIFTAPTTGVYYFRFTACGASNGHNTGVGLYRNQERLTYLSEYNNDGYTKHFSGGVTVHLSEGDSVYIRMPYNDRLYEDSNTRNIFSGFFLFPTEN